MYKNNSVPNGLLLVAVSILLISGANLFGAGELTYEVPQGWQIEAPSSSMRKAQFRLPRKGNDSEDGSLVVFYFGGAGGSVQANLQRWQGQIESNQEPIIEEKTVNGLKVTTVKKDGTYRAESRPGSGQRHNKPGFQLRASVVETPAGPYFFKLVGPKNTVEGWHDAFQEFIQSCRYKE